MKSALKIVRSIRGASEYLPQRAKHFLPVQHLGWISLIAIQELLKARVRASGNQNNIYMIKKLDGNSDNYRELNLFLEQNPQFQEMDNPMDNEIYMLVYVAKRLLKYGR